MSDAASMLLVALVALVAAGWTVTAIAARCVAQAPALLETLPRASAPPGRLVASVDRVGVDDATGDVASRPVSARSPFVVRSNDDIDLRGRVRDGEGTAGAVFVALDRSGSVRARYAVPPDTERFTAVVRTGALAPGPHTLRLEIVDAASRAVWTPLPPIRFRLR